MTADLAATFGDRFYCELQRHGARGETTLEAATVDLAYDMGVPLVATNEVYFAAHDDYEAHDALIAIAEGRRLGDDDRRRLTAEHCVQAAERDGGAVRGPAGGDREHRRGRAALRLPPAQARRRCCRASSPARAAVQARDAADDIEAEAERLRTMAHDGPGEALRHARAWRPASSARST